MSPSQQGFVYSMLLRHREIASRPMGRSAHPDEPRAARILSDCLPQQLEDFDEFLGAQGLALCVLDGFADLGIPPVAGRPSTHYILVRKYSEEIASFIDTTQFLDDFRDRRKERSDRSEVVDQNKAATVFWTARLWLTLQFFFYERIDRPVGNLTHWRDALVNEAKFERVVKEGIEALGNSGRPDGEAGLLWDVYWEQRGGISNMVTRFLKLMRRFGMLEATDTEGVYRQSLIAAVDMRSVSEQSLRFLQPAEPGDLLRQTRSLMDGYSISGEAEITTEEGGN